MTLRVAFHFFEARHGCAEAELIGIGGVDAADQRLSDPFQGFVAETAAHEGAEAFVAVSSPRGKKQLGRHAQLAGPGKERGLDKRPEARRREQEEPSGSATSLPSWTI